MPLIIGVHNGIFPALSKVTDVKKQVLTANEILAFQ
jgi:hypothetical protein